MSFSFVVATLFGYALRSYATFQKSMAEYTALVSETLFEKNMDNDKGVLLALSDAMEEQEFVETLLAYFFLWRSGPQTPPQLKARCEEFLQSEFGAADCAFEVTDALRKLTDAQLAGQLTGSGGTFSAVPLEAAVRAQRQAWSNVRFREL